MLSTNFSLHWRKLDFQPILEAKCVERCNQNRGGSYKLGSGVFCLLASPFSYIYILYIYIDGAEAYLSQDSREVNANLSERVTFAEASMKAVQSKTLCWKENALTAVVRT